MKVFTEIKFLTSFWLIFMCQQLVYAETRYIINITIGTSEKSIDKTRVVINESKSVSYESDCDASKFISESATYQIYTIGPDDTKYSINERPLKDGNIKIGIIVKTAGNVTISQTRMDCGVVIVDQLLNKEHPLMTSSYTYSSEAGTFENRFILHIFYDIPGDLNSDSKTTVTDLAQLTNYLQNTATDKMVPNNSDLNSDGSVDQNDKELLVNKILEQ